MSDTIVEPVEETTKPKTFETFGSFFVGDTEMAINVRSIQEVVNFPTQIIPMPLAPEYLVGIFNLRGLVIPIINLKSLLQYEDSQVTPSQKVAILEHQGASIGILFDSTSEIIRVADSDLDVFTYSGNAPKVISGAIKLDSGARILQVVDPMALIAIDNIPQILQQQKLNPKRMTGANYKHENRKKCITFFVKDMKLAFEISGINEILKVPGVQKSPMESDLCMGMINLRGQTIPIIDFAALLRMGSDPVEDFDAKRIIILKVGTGLFGLLVDSVESINTYLTTEIMPIPLLGKSRSKMFEGCVPLKDEGDVILLNHEHIFSTAEINAITQGHSKLFKSETERETKKKKIDRQTYVSFKVGCLFGVSIADVHEIINYSEDIANAPGMPSYVKGLLNLRGKIALIIDTRALYSMKESEVVTDKKILLFKNGNEMFGLVVDSLESIITLDGANKMKLPSLIAQGATGNFNNDVKEVVGVPGQDNKEDMLIVLNIEPIARRINKAVAA